MDLSEQLMAVAQQQSEEGEFPVWLLSEIVAIAENADLVDEYSPLVEKLIEQIRNFDPYAGAGCFDTSVNADSIQRTIQQIKAR